MQRRTQPVKSRALVGTAVLDIIELEAEHGEKFERLPMRCLPKEIEHADCKRELSVLVEEIEVWDREPKVYVLPTRPG